MCFDRPERYILEALEPIIKFKGYKAFDNGAMREFYSLLQSAMMGARKVGLLHRLINNQTLLSILAKMPANNWRQWTKERPAWIWGMVEEAFWTFIDQKWRDAINVAAAEPAGWGQGGNVSRPLGTDRRDHPGRAEAKKPATAAIHMATTDSKLPAPGGDPKRCKFADVLGCPGLHPPWRCGAFGSIRPEERARIIKDNSMCSFCLLHGEAEACRAKANKSKPACDAPEFGGQHTLWLHELLKGMAGQEGQVNMVQGGDGWKTPEEAWMEDEREAEEEVLFVNVMQAETTDSEEELADEIERTQVVVDECYHRRARFDIGNTEGRLLSEEELDDLSERLGDGEGAVWGRVSLPDIHLHPSKKFFFFCMYQLIHTTNMYLSNTHTFSSSYFIIQAIANIWYDTVYILLHARWNHLNDFIVLP
jgi:hypothetical protein